jgi:hypothetical protein
MWLTRREMLSREGKMRETLNWLSSGANVGVAIAAIAALFPIYQFFLVRRRESLDREFKTYHSLIEQLVSPGEKPGMFLDRQIAMVFELRHFKRYFECTHRILLGLRETWNAQPQNARLIKEIDLSLTYIKKKL